MYRQKVLARTGVAAVPCALDCTLPKRNGEWKVFVSYGSTLLREHADVFLSGASPRKEQVYGQASVVAASQKTHVIVAVVNPKTDCHC